MTRMALFAVAALAVLGQLARGADQPAPAKSSPLVVEATATPAAGDSPAHEQLLYKTRFVSATDLGKTLSAVFADKQRGGAVIVPETVSNSLLLSAPPATLKQITSLLSQLDRQPRTVRFSLFLLDTKAAPDAAGVAPAQAAAQEGFTGAADKVIESITALESKGAIKVLNTLNLVATEGTQATVQIGERQPRVTGSNFSPRGNTQSIVIENMGTLAKITPRIDADGTILADVVFEKSFTGSATEAVEVSPGQTVSPVVTLNLQQAVKLPAKSAKAIAAVSRTSGGATTNRFLLVLAAQAESEAEHGH